MMHGQGISSEEARRLSEEILADSRYERIRPDEGQLTDATMKAVEGYLGIIEWFERLAEESPGLHLLLTILMFLILCLLIWHIVWTFRKALRAETRPGMEPEGEPVDLAERLQTELEQALEDQAWTDALRVRFQLCLLHTSRRFPGRVRPGMTNRECLSIWKDQPHLANGMREVVAMLDRHWYSRQPCTEEEYLRAAAVIRETDP